MKTKSFDLERSRHTEILGGAILIATLLLGAVSAAAQDVKEQLRREAARAAAEAAGPEKIDPTQWPEVVAEVNGEQIHRIELMTQADLMRNQVVQTGGADPGDSMAFYREVLNGLVGEMLVFQRARATEKDATEAEIAEAISGMKARFGDQAAFEAELARQGSNPERLEKQIHRALSIQKFIDGELASKVEVPDEAKRAFFEQNKARMQIPERRRVRHIMFRASRDAAEDVRARANGRAKALRVQLDGETDFAEMARLHSEDSSTKEAGGDLGWITRSGARPEFEAAAFSLEEPGQISTVIETAAGYHIVQLVESQAARARTYDEVATEIGQFLKNGEMQRAVQIEVERLRSQAKVEIRI